MLISKRLLISTCVLGGGTLLLILGGALPAILSISSLQKQLAEEQNNIETRYLTRQAVRESMSSLESNRRALTDLKAAAIIEGQELAFISAIENQSDQAGVTSVIQLETANQRDLSSWEKDVPVIFTVNGPAKNVIRFLDGLERLPYAIGIDNVDINRGASGTYATDVHAKISGSIYWIGSRAPKFVANGDAATPNSATSDLTPAPASPK